MSSAQAQNKLGSKELYEQLAKEVDALKQQTTEQGTKVASAKAEKNKDAIRTEVTILKELKAQLEKKIKAWRKANPHKLNIDKDEFDSVMKQKLFFVPSFEIHAGPKGFFDWGPPGCQLKSYFIQLWRQHFVHEENMSEVDTSIMTPEKVFQISGHCKRFTDYIVKDTESGESFRADHLIEDYIERKLEEPKTTPEEREKLETIKTQIEGFTGEDMKRVIGELNISAPSGKPFTDPEPFNLMFKTSIGPSGKSYGFLRPETAQGIFTLYNRLYEANGSQVPFAAATIGKSFRNEISPEKGLIRVREFDMAEIEHFYNPKRKTHPKYQRVKETKMVFLSRKRQTEGLGPETMTIEETMAAGMITNETLAYFIGRVHQFMLKIGMIPEGIRFRQHLDTEMAHYADDCWDCELLTSGGWVECVGIADRSCFDLNNHADASGKPHVAYEQFDEPEVNKTFEPIINKKTFFKKIRQADPALMKEAQHLVSHLKKTSEDDLKAHQATLEKEGQLKITLGEGIEFTLTPDMISFGEVVTKVHGETFTPAVIEPSFGIGRIIFALLEHSFWIREDEASKKSKQQKKKKGEVEIMRSVLSLPSCVAPFKAAILPIGNKPEYQQTIETLTQTLQSLNLPYKLDLTDVRIGRRYARNDAIGIPFAITLDETNLASGAVTIRERDSCTQIIVPVTEVAPLLQSFVMGTSTWTLAQAKYATQEEKASASLSKDIIKGSKKDTSATTQSSTQSTTQSAPKKDAAPKAKAVQEAVVEEEEAEEEEIIEDPIIDAVVVDEKYIAVRSNDDGSRYYKQGKQQVQLTDNTSLVQIRKSFLGPKIDLNEEQERRFELMFSVGAECIKPYELRRLIKNKQEQIICYDGFEPSGRVHIAQGVMKMINVNKLTKAGAKFIFLVADWFALMNNKMGGDLKKIQTVGRYMVEVWKATGMDLSNVEFKWTSDIINEKSDEYWSLVLDIATRNSLSRITRCSQIMGRNDVSSLSAAQIFYPCMQCADIFFLKADICQLGMDQRKVNMLAREYCDVCRPKRRFKPIILSHPMLDGLKGVKMSKSDPDAAIFMEDSAADVKRKIKRAFCEPQNITKNPILHYVKHIILPLHNEFPITRPDKYGGNKTYTTYEDIEQDFATGELFPADLKSAAVVAINKILQPVRDHFASGEPKKLLAQVKKYRVTR